MRTFIAVPILLACLIAPATSLAANPTIFTDQNDGCATNGCSLREAITATNAGGTITLFPGTYEVSLPGVGENANASGDLDVTKSLTIVGAGASQTTISQTGLSGDVDGIFDVKAGLRLSDVTVRNGNRTNGPGGAFHVGEGTAGQLALARASVVNNQTNQNGGGIYVGPVASTKRSRADLTDVDLVSNRSSDNGGGIFAVGDTTLVRTTVRQNAADNGAGVFVERLSSSNRGTLDTVNTTFGANNASQDGGAIYDAGGLTVSFTTFNANQSGFGSSTLYLREGSAAIGDSIIASATDADCAGPALATGDLTSGGNNIQNGTTCTLAAGTDASATNPKLNALTTVGAPNNVPTYALAPDSPALGHSGACAVSEDARGLARSDGACDTGAREEQQTDLGVAITDSPDPVTVGDVLTYTITASNLGAATVAQAAVTASTPDGTSFIDATPSQGTCSGDTSIRCALGVLAPGGSATAVIRVRAVTVGTISNRTDVSSELTDSNKANNTGRATTIVTAAGVTPPPAGTPGPTETATPGPTPSATPTPTPAPTPANKLKLKLSSAGKKSIKVKATVGAGASVVLKLSGKGKVGTLVKTKKTAVKESSSKTITLTLSRSVRKRIRALAAGTVLKLSGTATAGFDTETSSLTLVVTKTHKLKVR